MVFHRWSRGAALAAGLVLLTRCAAPLEVPPPARERPYLLLHDWYGESPVSSPTYIRDHRVRLDSLPFDGIVAYVRSRDLSINVSAGVMSSKRLDYDDIETCLEPIHGLRFKNLGQNFAAVLGGDPPDFLDDWSAPVANFAMLARAARRAGLRGIYFDNENYHAPWGDFPGGVRHRDRSREDYEKAARRRGREVMEAMVEQFPDIVVILLHGPYVSDPRAPRTLFPQWQNRNELIGPFFAGFVDGAGPRAKVVDGGEIYHLRSDREFRDAFEWRKDTWRGAPCVRFAFGVYDRPFRDRPMDPEILEQTLARALRWSDSYVWLYVEGRSFLKPEDEGGARREWIDAVRRARSSGP